jgi:hypothetical protein
VLKNLAWGNVKDYYFGEQPLLMTLPEHLQRYSMYYCTMNKTLWMKLFLKHFCCVSDERLDSIILGTVHVSHNLDSAHTTKFYSLPNINKVRYVGHAAYPENSGEKTFWDKTTCENKKQRDGNIKMDLREL